MVNYKQRRAWWHSPGMGCTTGTATKGFAPLRILLCAALLALWQHDSTAADVPHPEVVMIDGGPFIAGSHPEERERAYRLDEEAYGHSRTRQWGWYDDDMDHHVVDMSTFFIMKNLVTQTDYARFVDATGHRSPDVDRQTWESYGLIHPYPRTRPYAWTDGAPPADRLDHPVVLVSHGDARAYARWLSRETGGLWRLPTALEWEKAARGTDGRMFPWGNEWDASRLNTHDLGPFATMPVGSFPQGKSPFGMMDAAGQVFEWTADQQRPGQHWVKGGSWDDRGCGICRPADRHGRPEDIRHILIGFRLVRHDG